jgi:hypothetical protein
LVFLHPLDERGGGEGERGSESEREWVRGGEKERARRESEREETDENEEREERGREGGREGGGESRGKGDEERVRANE